VATIKDSLPARIRAHGLQRGDDLAQIQGDEQQSWAEFSTATNRIANKLRQLGCAPGTRIALIGANTLNYTQALAGILTAGASAVPLPTMVTAETLTAMLTDALPRVIFVDDAYRDLLTNALSALDHAPDVVLLDTLDGWLGDVDDSYPNVEIDETDTFVVIYSSGTTGTPKGIVLSHGTRAHQTRTMAQLAFDESCTNIIATPLYSLGALSTWMPTVYGGGANVLMAKFDARSYLELAQRHRVTHTILVPIQYQRILDVPDFDTFDLTSLRFKFGGSAPSSVALKRTIAAKLPGEMFEFYSLTEGGVTTALMVNHFPDKLASVGVASNGCVIKIIDDDGHELPTGETGEIVGRSTLRMDGYLNKPTATDALKWLDEDGNEFIRSGDTGYLDAEGYLYLLDRKKDMIISGGMNVYAADIEAVLIEHPAVTEATVIGVPSERWGESPYGVVVLDSAESGAGLDVLSWANARLAASQRLADVEVRSSLPRNHLGKVLKQQLRDQLH
jgi:acyl-CoA synthetase (AMP-forming)/AMP-acid ligase II